MDGPQFITHIGCNATFCISCQIIQSRINDTVTSYMHAKLFFHKIKLNKAIKEK